MLITSEWSEGKLVQVGKEIRIQSANGGVQVRIFDLQQEMLRDVPLAQKEFVITAGELQDLAPCWISFKTAAGETHVHLEQM